MCALTVFLKRNNGFWTRKKEGTYYRMDRIISVVNFGAIIWLTLIICDIGSALSCSIPSYVPSSELFSQKAEK